MDASVSNLFAETTLFVLLGLLRSLFLFLRHGRLFLGLFLASLFFAHDYSLSFVPAAWDQREKFSWLSSHQENPLWVISGPFAQY